MSIPHRGPSDLVLDLHLQMVQVLLSNNQMSVSLDWAVVLAVDVLGGLVEVQVQVLILALLILLRLLLRLLLQLLLIHRLVLLVHKLDLVLLDQLLDLVLNGRLLQRRQDVRPELLSDLLPQLDSYLFFELLHDFHVGSLGDFGFDCDGGFLFLHLQGGPSLFFLFLVFLSFLPFKLFVGSDGVLLDVLVEDLVVELEGVLLSDLVVQLPANGLHHVALPRPRVVDQAVVPRLHAFLHSLLMSKGGVLLGDQPLVGGGVLLGPILVVELVHRLVESLPIPVLPLLVQLDHYLVKLLLHLLVFLFEILVLDLVLMEFPLSLIFLNHHPEALRALHLLILNLNFFFFYADIDNFVFWAFGLHNDFFFHFLGHSLRFDLHLNLGIRSLLACAYPVEALTHLVVLPVHSVALGRGRLLFSGAFDLSHLRLLLLLQLFLPGLNKLDTSTHFPLLLNVALRDL
mmetsp:Transcript_40366/g.38841  ORF Transcript_40366/g.38841 Transcript_40366/m.38841 type:complete len:457 (+) Transcript_40366:40-1410(+)